MISVQPPIRTSSSSDASPPRACLSFGGYTGLRAQRICAGLLVWFAWSCGAPEPTVPRDETRAPTCPPLTLSPEPPTTELAWRVQIHREGEPPPSPQIVWTRDQPIGEVDGVLRWVRHSALSRETWERTETTLARRVDNAWLTWESKGNGGAQAAGAIDTLRRQARDDECCVLEGRWAAPEPGEAWTDVLEREEAWTFCPPPAGLTAWRRSVRTPIGTLHERWQRAPGLDLR